MSEPRRGRTAGPPRIYYNIEWFRARNFKSLEDVRIDLMQGVNLLVGPNASGKSNLLEALAFLRRALVDAAGRSPYLPHVPWYWEPLDIIYRRDPGRNVSLEIGGSIYFGREKGERGREPLVLKTSFSIEVTFVYEETTQPTLKPFIYRLGLGEFQAIVSPEGVSLEFPSSLYHEARRLPTSTLTREALKGFTVEGETAKATLPWSVPPPDPLTPQSLPVLPRITETHPRRRGEYLIVFRERMGFLDQDPVSVFTLRRVNEMPRGTPLRALFPLDLVGPFTFLARGLKEILSGIILLRHPDIGSVGKPREIRGSRVLSERAENLAEVLLTLQAERGSLPEPVQYALRRGFPGLTVRLELGLGRVSLVAEEAGVRLNPPNLPDGLIKTLAIATAVSLEPSILLIDEVENSMHAELLELVIDLLNTINAPVLVATHSPIVVDLVEPKRIVVVSRNPGEPSRVERLSDKKELLDRLEELGVSLGDAVFHSITRRD